MIEILFGAVWVAGFLWASRFIIGWFLDDFGPREIGEGFAVGAIMSLIVATWAWPLIAIVRGGYVLVKRYGPEGSTLQSLFPPPKEVKSRTERQLEQARKDKDELAELRKWAERERGLKNESKV